ncbi:MAG: sodium ion-translocating decarboxylase subunit beta [Deltaproteobacteria bacterium]|nr:sodium ion-translocating decarboxylase subunit beta [Deltaproteobacteria bacterium]
MEAFLNATAFANWGWGNILMDLVALVFIFLAIKKHYEPLLLIPIGLGILIANTMPITIGGEQISFTDVNAVVGGNHTVSYYMYYGVRNGIYPPLIFLGIGAMTDFSFLLSNPRLVLLGAAAQFGIFATYIGALALGFPPNQAGAIGIIGGADGPTAIFLSSVLAPELLAPIAIAAYSYMALVPLIQPPIMRLLTTRKERLIRMDPPRTVSRTERIVFPVLTFLVTSIIAPGSAILVGFLIAGNLLRESGVTDRLAQTARTSFVDIITILIGIGVGLSASASTFLTQQSLMIFALGATSFGLATAAGVLFAKLMNLVSRRPINPLIGAAGVSAVPDSARVAQMVAQEEDPTNFVLMHAMGPNMAGVIGSAMAAGVLWSYLGSI